MRFVALVLAAIAVGGVVIGCGPEQFLSGSWPGDPCSFSSDCRSGMCLDLGHASGVGICTETCGGTTCALSGATGRRRLDGICSSGLCVPSGDDLVDELGQCGVVGPASFGPCEGGTVCVDWPDWLPTCSPRCSSSDDCGGAECVPTTAGPICSIYR